MRSIINENIFPTLHSHHSIIIDKLYKEKKENIEENDMYDQHFFNRLKDVNINKNLIEKLNKIFL